MTRKKVEGGTWCPEDGPNAGVDELDGLCAHCGATCTGPGADKALLALSKKKTSAEAAVLRAALVLFEEYRVVGHAENTPLMPLIRAAARLQRERLRRAVKS
jgi:hypothetical protein